MCSPQLSLFFSVSWMSVGHPCKWCHELAAYCQLIFSGCLAWVWFNRPHFGDQIVVQCFKGLRFPSGSFCSFKKDGMMLLSKFPENSRRRGPLTKKVCCNDWLLMQQQEVGRWQPCKRDVLLSSSIWMGPFGTTTLSQPCRKQVLTMHLHQDDQDHGQRKSSCHLLTGEGQWEPNVLIDL